MRKVLISIVLLLVVVLAAPWFCGDKLKEGYDHFLTTMATVDQMPGLTFELKDYKKGWFTSTATLVATISDPNTPQTRPRTPFSLQKVSVNFDETFKHGPVFFIDGKLKFGWGAILKKPQISPQVQAVIDMVFANQANKPQFNGVSVVNFGGDVDTTFTLPAFSYVDKMKQGQFNWKGLSLNIWLNKTFDKSQGLLDFTGMNANFMQTDVKVESTKIKFNLFNALPAVKKFWLGTFDFAVDEFSVHSPTQNFVLSGLDYSTNSQIKNALLDITANFKLDKLLVNDQSYGPANAEIALLKLDPEAMQTLSLELQKHPISGMQADPQELLAILPQIVKVVNKGSEYSMNKVTVQTPKGTVTGNLALSFIPGSDVVKTQEDAAKLLNRLKGELNLAVPAKLLNDFSESETLEQLRNHQKSATNNPQQPMLTDAKGVPVVPLTDDQLKQQATQQSAKQIQDWIKQGFLKQEGDQYKVQMTLNDGSATLNGKPFGKIDTLMNSKIH